MSEPERIAAAPSDDEIIRHVADQLPVGVWVARAPGGEFVYANQTFAEIMGQAGREDVAVGEYAAPYGIHGRDGALYPEERMPFVQAVRTRRTIVVDDIVIHRTDGRKVYVRAQARPCFDAAGELTHVIIAFIDISREVEAERARVDGEARLRQAQRMESIGSLAGGIAHDFNNLLGTIKLVTERLLVGEGMPESVRGELRVIDSITDRAAALTRSLLGFARRGKHLAQRISLNDVVRTLGALIQRTIDRRIAVELTLGSTDGEVVGDFSQLEQVLVNLMVNARDALPPEGGSIVVRTADVTLAEPEPHAQPCALAAGPHVLLEVSDSGRGIPPEVRDRIFEPYFTTKTTGPVRGTGLGLATVWGVVDSHGGAIRVDSRPGATTIGVLLPRASPTVEARRVTPAPLVPPPARHHGTVLIVDDEPLMRRAMQRALEDLGYAVLTADDGESALALYRERGDTIDVVVLDMLMPRMDGRATYLALRALQSDVKVLLSTGYALNEEAQAILDLGVRGFLSKPIALDALGAALAELVGEADARA